MTDRYPSERYAWYVVGVLMVASTLSFVDRQILSLLVEPIRGDLGLSDTQVSLLQGGAFTVTYVVMGFPIGRLADRASRRLIIAAGISAWSVMTAACGFAQTFWQLAATRMGVGIGEATLSPAGYSMMSDYFRRHRLPLAMSVYSMGIYIGSGLALILGGAALKLVSGLPPLEIPGIGAMRPWQMAFVVVGLPGVLVAALIRTLREPRRLGSRVGQGQSAPLSELLRFIGHNRWTISAHFGGISLLTLYGYAALAWMPTFLIRTYGFTPEQAGFAMGPILMIFGTLSALFGGWFAGRLMTRGFADGPMRAAAMGSTALFPIAVASYLMPTGTLFLVMMVPAMFLGSMHFGIAPAMMQLITPNELRGQMSAIMLLVTTLIGLGLGPTSVAVFTDYVLRDTQAIRYSMTLVAGISVPAAALILWLGLRPFRRSIGEAEQWTN